MSKTRKKSNLSLHKGISSCGHVCPVCSKSFPKRCVLLYHIKLHHTYQKAAFTCNMCPNQSFAQLASLVRHQIQSHPENELCHKCGQSFAKSDSLFNHICIEKRPYVCEGCGAGFAQLHQLSNHCTKCKDYSNYSPALREYHYCYKGSYRCCTCEWGAISLSDLIQHRITKHNDLPQSASSSSNTSITKRLHGQQVYKLDERLSIVSRRSCQSTQTATNDHLTSVVFSCQFCHASFNDGKSLDNHITNKHPFRSGKVHLCNKCGLYCVSNMHLLHHQKVEHPPECHHDSVSEVSPASVVSKESNAMMSSTFSCQYCGVVFMTRFSLSRHINKRHTQTSNPQENLARESPPNLSSSDVLSLFQLADVCLLEEKQLEDKQLNNHQPNGAIKSVHTSRAHRCHFCSKKFEDSKSLNLHIQDCRMKHGSKCDLCSKVLKNRATLLRHRQRMHFLNAKDYNLLRSHMAEELGHNKNKEEDFLRDTSEDKTSSNETSNSLFKCRWCTSTYHTCWLLTVHEKMSHCSEISTEDHQPKRPCIVIDDDLVDSEEVKEKSEHALAQNKISSDRITETACNESYVISRHSKKVNSRKKHKTASDRKFQCTECSQSYSNINAMRIHYAKIHETNRPFECDICGSNYIHKCSLNKHRKKCHNL